VLSAVEPFVEDVNEPVRFHAVATVFAQDDEGATAALCRSLVTEESVRVKNRICEGLLSRGWKIPEELQSDFGRAIPSGFVLDGRVVKRAR
jgi:hypothetical protein